MNGGRKLEFVNSEMKVCMKRTKKTVLLHAGCEH